MILVAPNYVQLIYSLGMLIVLISYGYVNLLRKHLSYDYVVKVREC